MFIALLVLGGFALYVMNGEERARLRGALRHVHVVLLRGLAYAIDLLTRFVRAFRAKNRWARIAAAALIVLALAGVAGRWVEPPRDIRADIEQLASTETRIANMYDAAAGQFKLGAMTAPSLAQLIDLRIKPELHVAHIRVLSLERVRPDQAVLLVKAKEYLRLREESWRLRADALNKRNLAALRRVETTERASLAALDAAVQAARSM